VIVGVKKEDEKPHPPKPKNIALLPKKPAWRKGLDGKSAATKPTIKEDIGVLGATRGLTILPPCGAQKKVEKNERTNKQKTKRFGGTIVSAKTSINPECVLRRKPPMKRHHPRRNKKDPGTAGGRDGRRKQTKNGR